MPVIVLGNRYLVDSRVQQCLRNVQPTAINSPDIGTVDIRVGSPIIAASLRVQREGALCLACLSLPVSRCWLPGLARITHPCRDTGNRHHERLLHPGVRLARLLVRP